MENNIIKTLPGIIQHRRGDGIQGKIPYEGEIVIGKDNGTLKLKIGDGNSSFEELKYYADDFATESYVEEKLRKRAIPKVCTITLRADDWYGDQSPWEQQVVVDNYSVTALSKVDLQPNVEQLAELTDEEITLVAVNTNAIVVVYAINGKPKKDYKMKVLVTEIIK